MATDFGNRLRAAQKHAKKTQQQVAKEVGMGQGTLSELMKIGTGSAFTTKIARACGVDAHWLATGEGPMVLGNTEPGPDMQGKVPLISWVQAGEWCHASEPLSAYHAERWMECPKAHSDQTFVLRVRGDSMTATHGRTYPEGCYIFVDGAKRSPANGERVVACLENSNETTFKVFKSEDGRTWLQPLNTAHEPIRQPFHILGTVIGKWEDE